MKVFVIHYTQYTDRKTHILREFEKHNICNYVFIENYDKEDLTDSDRFNFEPSLAPGKISLVLKHIEAYRRISTEDPALIVEDDVILQDGFMDTLEQYYRELPSDFDMCFIGSGGNLHIESNRIRKDIHIYEKMQHPKTRCTDSYLITPVCAKNICEYFDTLHYKIPCNIDLWLNGVIGEINAKIYWAEPTIVTQGSETGLFTPSSYL